MVMANSETKTVETSIHSTQRKSSSLRFQNHRPAASTREGHDGHAQVDHQVVDLKHQLIGGVGGTSKESMPATVHDVLVREEAQQAGDGEAGRRLASAHRPSRRNIGAQAVGSQTPSMAASLAGWFSVTSMADSGPKMKGWPPRRG